MGDARETTRSGEGRGRGEDWGKRIEITRRQFLAGAGAAAVGAGIILRPGKAGAEVVEAAENYGLWTAGIVDAVKPPSTMHLGGFQENSPLERLKFSADATFWRDRFTDLPAFRPGDEVYAEGRWEGDVFAATYLTCVWSTLEGVILSKGDDQIVTSGGTIHIIPETQIVEEGGLIGAQLPELLVGEHVHATGRFDRRSNVLIAQKITKGSL